MTKNPDPVTRRMVAVDPGGEHVGVAIYETVGDGWCCVAVREFQPIQFQDWLTEQMYLGLVDHLVVEQFTLYPDMAQKLAGSEMETSQLIGVIKYIHRATLNRRTEVDLPCTLEFQPASVKTPTRAILKSRLIQPVSARLRVPGDHVRDAELHGAYAVIRTRDLPVYTAVEVYHIPVGEDPW